LDTDDSELVLQEQAQNSQQNPEDQNPDMFQQFSQSRASQRKSRKSKASKLGLPSKEEEDTFDIMEREQKERAFSEAKKDIFTLESSEGFLDVLWNYGKTIIKKKVLKQEEESNIDHSRIAYNLNKKEELQAIEAERNRRKPVIFKAKNKEPKNYLEDMFLELKELKDKRERQSELGKELEELKKKKEFEMGQRAIYRETGEQELKEQKEQDLMMEKKQEQLEQELKDVEMFGSMALSAESEKIKNDPILGKMYALFNSSNEDAGQDSEFADGGGLLKKYIENRIVKEREEERLRKLMEENKKKEEKPIKPPNPDEILTREEKLQLVEKINKRKFETELKKEKKDRQYLLPEKAKEELKAHYVQVVNALEKELKHMYPSFPQYYGYLMTIVPHPTTWRRVVQKLDRRLMSNIQVERERLEEIRRQEEMRTESSVDWGDFRIVGIEKKVEEVSGKSEGRKTKSGKSGKGGGWSKLKKKEFKKK
jgi:hypothetical protein